MIVIDGNNNFYKYSACRRRIETYTKRSNQILLNERNKNNIIPIETELSKYNSRTTNIKTYKEFITKKTETNNKLFRKLSFRRFVKTKQSEVRLLNEIENKFLTKEDKLNNIKLVMFIGDYSRTSQMKGTISTPNIGFKKLLLTRFNVIEVNEYNTSKLYNKTLKEMENVKIRRKKHIKYLH